jgi:hypothetical protein
MVGYPDGLTVWSQVIKEFNCLPAQYPPYTPLPSLGTLCDYLASRIFLFFPTFVLPLTIFDMYVAV